MQGIRDSLRKALLTVLVVVLAVVLLWIVLRRVLIVVGLIALGLLALRLAFGGSTRGKGGGCKACGRDIPVDASICPYCFELQPRA